MFCSFAACEGKVLATRIAVWKNPNFVLCENFPKDLFWWKIHSRRFNCKEVTESERAESEGKRRPNLSTAATPPSRRVARSIP